MTRLEKDNPKIKELADKLGLKVYYRSKAYWAGQGTQLTFETEKIEGKSIPVNWPRNLEIAQKILEELLDDRNTQEQTPVIERLNYVLNGLKTTPIIPKHFCTFGNEDNDHATIAKFFTGYYGAVRIKGYKEVVLNDISTSDLLIEELKRFFIEKNGIMFG